MAKKQYLDLAGLTTYDEQIKSYIDAADAATSTELTDGTVVVKEAEHAETADSATNATNATNANHATSADSATTAGSATKATQDGNGNNIASTYETKTDATAKLAEAKSYTDTEVAKKADSNHNHDTKYDAKGAAASAQTAAVASAKSYTDGQISALLDGADDDTLNSIKELADAIKENDSAIDALNGIAAGKADASALSAHTGNGDIHVTAAKKANWDAAYTHSTSAHAPTNAQANVIETIKVNGTALTPTSKAVNITVPTDYLVAADIANKADKATTLAGYGITDAYTKSEVDAKTAVDTALSTTSTKPVQNKLVTTAINSNTSAISANTSSITAHTSRISALEGLVGEGIESIPTASITALFA